MSSNQRPPRDNFITKLEAALDSYLKYKLFRAKVINPIQTDPSLSKEDRLNFRSIQVIFPFAIFNVALAGFVIRKNYPWWVRLSIITAISSFFYLTTTTIGEKIKFEENLQRKDYLGYFLRKKYQQQTAEPNKFFKLDQEFEQIYIQPCKHIDSSVKAIIQKLPS